MLASGKAHFIYDRVVPKARKQTGNLIAETAGGGATGSTGTVREYIYLPETEIAPTMGSRTVVDRPVAVVNAVNTTPVIWQVHVDHLNRPIRMTDAAKASVWDVVWAPWGNVYSISGTATLDARFPGQWYQLESGLHYNWHRHYDPTLGRYTQPDPLGFVDGPSVYGYALADPGATIDRFGLFSSLPQSKPDVQSPVQQCNDPCNGNNKLGQTYKGEIVGPCVGGGSGGRGGITEPYKRPNNATTPEQRASVQGQPCVDCGAVTPNQRANHIDPLVQQYYRDGKIDVEKMRSPESVNAHCPTCSASQGGQLSAYSKALKKLFGF